MFSFQNAVRWFGPFFNLESGKLVLDSIHSYLSAPYFSFLFRFLCLFTPPPSLSLFVFTFILSIYLFFVSPNLLVAILWNLSLKLTPSLDYKEGWTEHIWFAFHPRHRVWTFFFQFFSDSSLYFLFSFFSLHFHPISFSLSALLIRHFRFGLPMRIWIFFLSYPSQGNHSLSLLLHLKLTLIIVVFPTIVPDFPIRHLPFPLSLFFMLLTFSYIPHFHWHK